jgi:hypothetical protein
MYVALYTYVGVVVVGVVKGGGRWGGRNGPVVGYCSGKCMFWLRV